MVGVGYRPELQRLFGPRGTDVECVELIANRYFADDGVGRPWELETLVGMPTLVHGLSGNVASAIGPGKAYLESIARLADQTGAITYSDHLAFTGVADRELGHLAPNRFDDELLDLACGHIELMNEVTGMRPCLENLATKTMMTGSQYTPEEFYLALLDRSDGWDCLLDLTNIWINGQNRPVDPVEWVTAIPPERVRYVHLAGGQWIHGELVDTHSEAVHAEAFDLLAYLLRIAEPQAVIVERDSNWVHGLDEVTHDLARAREVRQAAGTVPHDERRSA